MTDSINVYATVKERREAISRLIREETKPRLTFTITTPVLAANTGANLVIPDAFANYGILSAQTNTSSWVSVYIDENSRNRDAGRSIDSDPYSNAGVVLEFITGDAETIPISPIIPGYTLTGEDRIPLRVTNTSGTSKAIEVTFTLMKM